MTAAVPPGSVVLQGFMTPHLNMRPENRKAGTDNRRDTGTGYAVSLRAKAKPVKEGVIEMNRLQ